MDKFQRIAMIPHAFDQNVERTIIVFCKGDAPQKQATEAGATLVGGPELIKDIQSGEVNLANFNYVIAHPNILPELVAIRGKFNTFLPKFELNSFFYQILFYSIFRFNEKKISQYPVRKFGS